MKEQHTPSSEPAASFLPDFCSNQNTLLIVLIAELLALIIALSDSFDGTDFWLSLGLSSLFIQWLALGSAAALCWSRKLLNRLGTVGVTVAVFLLTQSITVVFTVFALLALDHELVGFQAQVASRIQFLLNTSAISSIVVLLLLRYFYIHHQWRLNVHAQAQTQLQALQNRIRPHFLFNSLNSIASLIRTQPEQAENAVLDLSDLLRFILKNETLISLREEIELCRDYLRLEQLRMGERLEVRWELDERLPLDSPIPCLILQPLLENAVYHGISPLPDGGEIKVHIGAAQGRINIEMSNPIASNTMTAHSGSGIALDNIRRRLQLLYGNRAKLNTQTRSDTFGIKLTLPYGERVL